MWSNFHIRRQQAVQDLLHKLVVTEIPELEEDSTNLDLAVSFASQHLSKDNIHVQKSELSSIELLSKLKGIEEKLKINSWHASAQRLSRCTSVLLSRERNPAVNGSERKEDREVIARVVNALLDLSNHPTRGRSMSKNLFTTKRIEAKRFSAGDFAAEDDAMLEEWLEETRLQPEKEVSSESDGDVVQNEEEQSCDGCNDGEEVLANLQQDGEVCAADGGANGHVDWRIKDFHTAGSEFEILYPLHPCSAASLHVAYVERRLALLGRIPENYGLLKRPSLVSEGFLIRQLLLALQGNHADVLLSFDPATASFTPTLKQLTTVCTTPALVNSLLQTVAVAASQRGQIQSRLDKLEAKGSQTLNAFSRGVRLCLAQVDSLLGELEVTLQHPGIGLSHTDIQTNTPAPTLTAISCAIDLVASKTRRLWNVVDKVCDVSEKWDKDVRRRTCAIIDWILNYSRIVYCCSLQPRDKEEERYGTSAINPSELVTLILYETLTPLFRYLDRLLAPTALPTPQLRNQSQEFSVGMEEGKSGESRPSEQVVLPAFLRTFIPRILTLSKAIRLLKNICPTDEGLASACATLEDRLTSLKVQRSADEAPIGLISGCIHDHIEQPHFHAMRHRLVNAVLKGQGLLNLTHTVRSLFLFEHEHYMYEFVLLLYNSLDPPENASVLLDNLGHDVDVDRLLTTKLKAELSEFLEAESIEDISVTVDAQRRGLSGLDLLGQVRLHVDVPSPLNIVIDEHVIRGCQAVFAFLLKTKAVNYQLNRFQHRFRRKLLRHPCAARTSALHRLTVMLMEELNFCHNLQNHLMRRMRVHSWESFVAEVQAAKGIEELRTLHKSFLDDICKSCFLNPSSLDKKTPIHGVLLEILKVSVKFKRTASKAFSEWPDRSGAINAALSGLEATHNSFCKAKSFLEKINSYANKEDEFLL